MANRSLTSLARKALLRRGRSILRMRPSGGDADYLAGLSDAQRHELEEIHAALERIERGIFGACEGCGARVERERIEKIPYERLCQGCSQPEASADSASMAAEG